MICSYCVLLAANATELCWRSVDRRQGKWRRVVPLPDSHVPLGHACQTASTHCLPVGSFASMQLWSKRRQEPTSLGRVRPPGAGPKVRLGSRAVERCSGVCRL